MELVDALKLINKYGIPVAKYWVIEKLEDLEGIASKLVYPLVVKISSKAVIHKSDVGGIVTNIKTYDELKDTIMLLEEKFRHLSIKRWLIQEMVEGDVELIIGGLYDEVFGPVVMFGLGGMFTEIYHDVTFRLAPLSVRDALDMINSIKAKIILEGYRGIQPINKEKIAEIIVKVSKIISTQKNIKEIDVNPVICKGEDIKAVDARIVLKKEN